MSTIKDIAEAAGISIGTVDRIIHKRGRYSEKTAARVRKIMDEMGYVPNIHARGLKKTKSYRFAAVLPYPDQDSAYWRLVLAGVKRAASELGSFGSQVEIYHFDRYSAESCSSVLRSALGVDGDHPDGLMIAPVRPGEMRGLLEESDLPYLFIDTDIPGLSQRLSYIGQDSRQSGILSGKLMNLLLAKRSEIDGPVLLINPPGENYHLRERMAGFLEYLTGQAEAPKVVRLKEETDSEETFHRSMDERFPPGSALPAGIFVANSSVYYVASWLEKRGQGSPSTPLIGYDLIPGREGYIERGTVDFILTQQPEEQGYRGVRKLYDSQVLGRRLERDFIIPLNIITKENLHTFEQYNKEMRKGIE